MVSAGKWWASTIWPSCGLCGWLSDIPPTSAPLQGHHVAWADPGRSMPMSCASPAYTKESLWETENICTGVWAPPLDHLNLIPGWDLANSNAQWGLTQTQLSQAPFALPEVCAKRAGNSTASGKIERDHLELKGLTPSGLVLKSMVEIGVYIWVQSCQQE